MMRQVDWLYVAMKFMKCIATSDWKDDDVPIVLLSIMPRGKDILFSIRGIDVLQHISRLFLPFGYPIIELGNVPISYWLKENLKPICWVNKMWYTYIMEYYSASKRNEALIHARTWMYGNIMLIVRIQTQKSHILYDPIYMKCLE